MSGFIIKNMSSVGGHLFDAVVPSNSNSNSNSNSSFEKEEEEGGEEGRTTLNNETVTGNLSQFEYDWPFFTPEQVYFFLLVFMLVLSVFGIAANVANMMTYWKLRHEDPINVNLLGLALSDWVVCFTTFSLFLGTAYWYSDDLVVQHKFMPVEVIYLVVGVPHSVSVRVTVLLTASIALQRCLGVVHPLKVKSIVTISRVKASVVFSFVLPIVMIMPGQYYLNRLEWVTVPGMNNMTVLRHVMTDDFFDVGTWTSTSNSVILLVIPFGIVTVCTGTMIKHLKFTMNWRLHNANANHHLTGGGGGVGGGGGSVANGVKVLQPPAPLPLPLRTHHHHLPSSPPPPSSSSSSSSSSRRVAMVTKEMRIVKLVLTLSCVFLVCYAPNIILAALTVFTPNFNIQHNHETQQLVAYVIFLLDTLNSSINIFVYFRHSTNYNKAFRRLFCHKTR